MTKMDFDQSMEEMQGCAEGDFLQGMLQHMMQYMMEVGVDAHVGAGRHERTAKRKGHRNGYKPRSLNTRMGKMDLQVPQVRGMEPYSPRFFAKWQRSERALLVACAEMYFMGVSTRKVKNVLEKMGGFDLLVQHGVVLADTAEQHPRELSQFRVLQTFADHRRDGLSIDVRVQVDLKQHLQSHFTGLTATGHIRCLSQRPHSSRTGKRRLGGG